MNDSLMIHGKSFYVKEQLEALGGTWNPFFHAWRIPLLHDSTSFRNSLIEQGLNTRKSLLTKIITCEMCERMGESIHTKVCNSCA